MLTTQQIAILKALPGLLGWEGFFGAVLASAVRS